MNGKPFKGLLQRFPQETAGLRRFVLEKDRTRCHIFFDKGQTDFFHGFSVSFGSFLIQPLA